MLAKILALPSVQAFIARAKAKPLNTLGICAAIVVVVVGILMKRHEHHQQMIASDINRVSDLAEIESSTEKYFLDHDKLPESLPELEGDAHPNPNFVRDDYLFDPETKRLHDYKILTVRSYQVCADFHYGYEKESGVVPYGVDDNSIWRHGAGHQCFKFFVTRDPKSK